METATASRRRNENVSTSVNSEKNFGNYSHSPSSHAMQDSHSQRHICHSFLLTALGYSYKTRIKSASSSENLVLIEFPKFCVLGSRRITLEIFAPEPGKVLDLGDGWTLASAVVEVCQAKDEPFLRKVKMQLPLIQPVDVQDPLLLSVNCGFGKTVKLEENFAVIESFQFSPAGVALKVEQMKKFLRPLEHFDEDLIFNERSINFTMKQHARKNVTGNFSLEFNCRPFEDRTDHEQHRRKENWSFSPIKYSESSAEDKIPLRVKRIRAPIKFENFDEAVEFAFGTELQALENTENINSWSLQKNKIVKDYEFTTRGGFEHPHITFELGPGQIISFPILPESELLSLNSDKILSARILQDFLCLLDDKIIRFLKSELRVNKEDLFEFLVHDIVEVILAFLTEKTEHLKSPFHDESLLYYELSVLRQRRELDNFATNLKDSDRKDRIIRICAENYQQMYFKGDEIKAKKDTLQLLGITCENCALLEKNVEILSRLMIYVDNKELLKHMQNAFEKDDVYQLKQKLERMSESMQKLLITTDSVDAIEVGPNAVPTVLVEDAVVRNEAETTTVEVYTSPPNNAYDIQTSPFFNTVDGL